MKYFFEKLQVIGLAGLFFLLVFLGSNGVCTAESQALQQLLDLLRQNGAISDEQAGKITATMAEERKALADREQEVEKRERALLQREQALKREVKTSGAEIKKTVRTVPEETKGFPLEAVFDDGFYLRSRKKDLFELRIGGLLQVDYRYFNYDSNADPDKNKFDIRRARLLLTGHLYNRFFLQISVRVSGGRGPQTFRRLCGHGCAAVYLFPGGSIQRTLQP